MAIPVLVIGRSGSGKTYSLKNFTADEVGVISVEKGRLPFRSDIKVLKVPKDPTQGEGDAATVNAAKYAWITSVVRNGDGKGTQRSAKGVGRKRGRVDGYSKNG